MFSLNRFPKTASIRPWIVCGVLRNVSFTEASYKSFIDLQDKLHGGLGRNRTIVSMGTHDLDRLQGTTFTYEALPPEQIRFRPLNQPDTVDGKGLMELLEGDLKLRKFLPIIRDSPVYPVLFDEARQVLSLPPIINGDRSKISLATRNVLVEVTATDPIRAAVALATICTAFATPIDGEAIVETVEIVYPDGLTVLTPSNFDGHERVESVSVAYINGMLGLELDAEQVCSLLKRMMLRAWPQDNMVVQVSIPPNRSDILHACDLMEDVAIAYGFNRLPNTQPPKTCTVGKPLPINKLSDLLRREVALLGFSEICTFTLCSHDENFAFLNHPDGGAEAVVVENPKTAEFQVVHSSLIPQILKMLASNRAKALPIKIFQVLDVCLQDPHVDVGARNERRLCAAYCNLNSGFEVIHGLLDRLMQMLDVKPAAGDDSHQSSRTYRIVESQRALYFPNRQADVFLGDKCIGSFGIVHPEVLERFEAPYVCSVLEMNIEPFL